MGLQGAGSVCMEAAYLELTPVGRGIRGMGVVPVYACKDPSALQTQQMAEIQTTHLLGAVPYSKNCFNQHI